jgi:DNA-binding beta-propeller fold protein YncE
VAALGNNTVEIVDVNQGKRLHSIASLHEPQGILYLPDVNRLYVAIAADGTVQVFDGTTYGPINSISLGSDADNVRFDGEHREIYVGYEAAPWASFVRTGAWFVRSSWKRILSPFSSKPWAIEFS